MSAEINKVTAHRQTEDIEKLSRANMEAAKML
jgi:hypothetical protein